MNTSDSAPTPPNLDRRSIYKFITNTRRISLSSLKPSKPWPAAPSTTNLANSKPYEFLIAMPGVGAEGKQRQPSAATLPPGEIPKFQSDWQTLLMLHFGKHKDMQ